MRSKEGGFVSFLVSNIQQARKVGGFFEKNFPKTWGKSIWQISTIMFLCFCEPHSVESLSQAFCTNLRGKKRNLVVHQNCVWTRVVGWRSALEKGEVCEFEEMLVVELVFLRAWVKRGRKGERGPYENVESGPCIQLRLGDWKIPPPHRTRPPFFESDFKLFEDATIFVFFCSFWILQEMKIQDRLLLQIKIK